MRNKKKYLVFGILTFIILFLSFFSPKSENYSIWKNEYNEQVFAQCCDLGIFTHSKKDNYVFLIEKSSIGKSRLVFTGIKKIKGIFYYSDAEYLYKIGWSKENELPIEINSAFKIDNGKYTELPVPKN